MTQTETARKCSIEGCGESTVQPVFPGSTFPYCPPHERKYGREWARCWECKRWCVAKIPDGHNACSLHGGADYVPRTKETESTPTPCLICGVPLTAATPLVVEWRYLSPMSGEERAGMVHSGCKEVMEVILRDGPLVKGKV